MAGTYVVLVPAGSTSVVQAVTPLTNVFLGPQVLGGQCTLYFGPTPTGPWSVWSQGVNSTSGGSYRPLTNGYVYAAAATQQAALFMTDMGGCNVPGLAGLSLVTSVVATPNSTAIQPLFSIKIPPNYLPTNFRLNLQGTVSMTNNANVKTLTCLMNGIGGTSFFTSPSLASNAAYCFTASCVGDGTGQVFKGMGAGATGGLGLSTTAVTTLARDYLNNETEFVVAATKATGTDTFQLESLAMTLF